ncbi:MAG: heavy metal-binding domain-containing protein [Eubacteriales bacterium]|nr:heavy metal-binding domain-containing protein [Eubacteriales bacterium]
MIITTTSNVEGYVIQEYVGLVFGEVIAGVNFLTDIGAGFRNFFGGRSKGYEDELIGARNEAINEMATRAAQLGANAIVGCKMDYEVLGEGGTMLMVTVSGTAVRIA